MANALRISIGLNVLLGLALIALLASWSSDSIKTPPEREIATRPSQEARGATPVPGTAFSIGKKDRLAREDVQRIEAAGVPRQVLVQLVLQQFDQRWEKYAEEYIASFAPRRVPEEEYRRLSRKREESREAELKAALGEAGYLEWDKEEVLRNLNYAGVPMSEAEAERAYRAQKEFDAQYREIEYAMDDGVMDRADAMALQTKAQDKLEQELSAVFGDERMRKLRGEMDPTLEVQQRFAEFEPTREQAKALAEMENEWQSRESALQQRLQAGPLEAAEITEHLKTIDEMREEEMRQLFGKEAYEEKKRAGDSNYNMLKRYAALWKMSDTEVESVHLVLSRLKQATELEQRSLSLREAAGQPVNWRHLSTAVDALRAQTEAELATIISAEKLHRLKQNGLVN